MNYKAIRKCHNTIALDSMVAFMRYILYAYAAIRLFVSYCNPKGLILSDKLLFSIQNLYFKSYLYNAELILKNLYMLDLFLLYLYITRGGL